MPWNIGASPEALQALAAELLTGPDGAVVYLEQYDAVLGWGQGDEYGYIGPDGAPLQRVELGLRENGVGAPPDEEPGIFYSAEEFEPDPADPLGHSRTMVVQFLPIPPTDTRSNRVAVEVNADGECYCTRCGNNDFEFRESIASWRSMRENTDRRLVFAGIGDDGDGDDDPGVVCSHCELPAVLPDDVTVDWSSC